MKHATIEVRAIWDEEAKIWTATSTSIDGLTVEAESLDALEPKILAAIQDLLELNGSPSDEYEIPIHILPVQRRQAIPPRGTH